LEEAERIIKQSRAKKQQNHLPPDESKLSAIEVKHSDKKDAMDISESLVYDCITIENM